MSSTDTMMDEKIEAAKAMRYHNMSWEQISRVLDVPMTPLRRAIDPQFARREHTRHPKPAPSGFRAEPKVSPADAAAALASIPRDTRGFTARMMGDPLPGRSALDRRIGR